MSRTCVYCGKPTANPRFCTKSCAAKYNNPKRQRRPWKGKYPPKTYQCQTCGKPLDRLRINGCHECRRKDYGSLTLSEVKSAYGSRNAYDTTVRQHARMIAQRNGLLCSCAICGYSNFVDCCHIQPVAEFSDSCTLAEVNAPENLVGLCPNHHKEFDAGIINRPMIILARGVFDLKHIDI